MVMCSKCHKRVAVIFVTKMENGKKTSEGICLRCAKEMGLPVDNMLGDVFDKFNISPDQIDTFEDNMNEMLSSAKDDDSGDKPSDMDDNEDGGAPAIDFPKLFEESGIVPAEEETSPDKPRGGRKDGKQKQNKKEYKFLGTYCRNLTAAARKGRLDTIVGRDRELSRVTQILCRRQKNNPCLIGEPGVGKTAIAEALAIRIASGNVPYKLKNKEILLLDLAALVAGTQFRGQFESRILGLLAEVKEAGNVILVIDEVHNIVGAGNSEGSMSAANILKPALSRGELQLIGATTLTEYRKYIEKDTALERRFQPIIVNEPSVAETVEMLRGIKHYYEQFHGIHIPEEILTRAVTLSERYITDRYLPDKAIDLLDEAASYLSLSSAELNESYEIRDSLLKKKTEREALESEPASDDRADQVRFEEITKIKADELKLSARLNELEPACEKITLGVKQLADVIEIWTGIPASSISEDEYARLDKLDVRLKEHIVGQDEAVEAVVRAIKRNRAGIAYKRKPVSFIFAGPTGVGKTELVKTLANDLFQSPETLIRLDMSEFMEKYSVSRIIGAPPGYVGYDEAGQLTEKIRRRPYSIVLFDEIEKAHPDVMNILLQILDDGRITDAQGRTVNFENTVIVMTTNAGSDTGTGAVGFTGSEEVTAKAKTEKALAGFLRPEFLNRVDEIITFRALSRDDFKGIAEIMLGQLAEALKEKELEFRYTPAAAEYIAEHSYSSKFGARNMRRYIQREVEDPLAELIIADYEHKYRAVELSVSDGKLSVACTATVNV